MGTYGQLLIHSNRHLHIGQTTAPCHSPRPMEFSLHHNKSTNLFFWLQIRDCSAPPRRGHPPGVKPTRAASSPYGLPHKGHDSQDDDRGSHEQSFVKPEHKARSTRPYRFLEPTPPRGRRHRNRSKSSLRGRTQQGRRTGGSPTATIPPRG